jgi:LPS export ABC transporter protein LptC
MHKKAAHISWPLLIIIMFLLQACENDVAVVNTITAEAQRKLPAESGKNVEIIYSDSAMLRARLVAKQLDRYIGNKSYMELPQGVKVVFYDENRKEETKMTADYGIGYDDGQGMNKMEAKRNVVVINEKGERLNTEHLIWNALTKKIYTDAFVKITTKEQTIWGNGMTANQDFSEYEIRDVQGILQANESDLEGEAEQK